MGYEVYGLNLSSIDYRLYVMAHTRVIYGCLRSFLTLKKHVKIVVILSLYFTVLEEAMARLLLVG